MPLDTSILNVGEYFSSHYLDTAFAKDIKALLDRWRDAGSQSPPRRLQALSTSYFRAKSQALEEELPENRAQAGDETASWHGRLLEALGYADLRSFDFPVEGGKRFVPTLGRVNRYNQPWLVVCETHFTLPDGSLKEGRPSEDPFEMQPALAQLHDPSEHALCEGAWSRCLGRVFTEEEAPRWILFLGGSQILLLDRNTYSQGRYLAFDLDDAFGRRERETFNHIAAFLSAEALCPGGESAEVLLENLGAQSHRFAHGVTEKLQVAVREAIVDLVNEWAYDRTERRKLALQRFRPEEARAGGAPAHQWKQLDDGSYEITAEHLKREALTFVYRLLFCFYAEARGGELEILPIDDDKYRLGYSLESLRDLEQIPLTAATEEGTYFHEHLKQLFRIIHQGFHPDRAAADGNQMTLRMGTESKTFVVRPLTATLFSPESTPLLNRARLSNRCLQRVIRLLSLSTDDKSRTVGRVNYAELGINQLGAVYEGLLSYKGQFADRDLIHVKAAGNDFCDKKTPTWFVPKERLEEFKADEVERVAGGAPRIYRKGEFILHLNGIDREQSASYYTPEVLTRCLVEESLRELLKDYAPGDADRILDLKICEPAMGSGAFLNEAAEQLAHRYLELKQKQLGQSIEPAQYGDELRRVKHFITTRNVYGVDLNATAVELGALSLWLGSIHRLLLERGENGARDGYQPGATPWFGMRLRSGNSLIGARRAVWTADQLRKGQHCGNSGEIPRLLKPGERRAENEIYHFLVFDEEMIPTHADKLMRQFWPEACGAAKSWLKNQVKPKWSDVEVREALDICALIDRHWDDYARRRADALLAQVGLAEARTRRLGEYSKGMARRLGLAQALINDPDLVILDEPTSGLDPIGTAEVKDLIAQLKRRGKTILLCSHLLADVEDVCDRICILYQGTSRVQGRVDELLTDPERSVVELRGADARTLARGFETLPIGEQYPRLAMPWLNLVPDAIYWGVRHLREQCGFTGDCFISENGCAANDQLTPQGEVLDVERVLYLREYLRQVHRCVAEGLPLTGYFAWSFLDNFEWSWGYAKRFGLVYVNYETQQRIPKHSARWYAECIRQNRVV